MRLSDIRGDRVLDVIADLIDPICNIAQDNQVAQLLKKRPVPEATDPRAFAVERLKREIPGIIRTHKTDIIAILATLEGVPSEKYCVDLSMSKLLRDCTQLLTDQEFVQLFISAQQEEQNTSGAAQENTTAPEA